MGKVFKYQGKTGASWGIRYMDPDKKYVRLQGFETKKAAALELAAREVSVADGSYYEKGIVCKTTLGEMIEGPYKDNFGHQPSYRNKAIYLAQFKEWISERKGADPLLSSISYSDLDAYRNHLKNADTYKNTPHTPRGVNSKISAIHQLFVYAVKLQLLKSNPFNGDSLKLKQQKNTRQRFLDKVEIRKLLDESGHDRDLQRRIIFALHTGMDHEDIMRLTWGDITPDRKIWTYRSKLVRDGARKDFQIPLNGEIRALLKEIRAEVGLTPPDRPIFDRRVIYDAFNAAVKRAGLYSPDREKSVTFKTLRHTFGSHLAMAGRHPKEIADLMGHSRLEQTMTYMHLAPNKLEEAVTSLEGLTVMSKIVKNDGKNAEEPRHSLSL